MTKRKEVEYGPHPAGDGAAVWFHAVLTLVFVAEFVLGIFTLPLSRSIGVALLAVSPLGIWFHTVGAWRHFQEWRDAEDDDDPWTWRFVAPGDPGKLPRDPDGPDLTPRVDPPTAAGRN